MPKNPETVVLKGHRDGIRVIIDRNAGFAEVAERLRAKVSGARSFFDDANTNITFKGRYLTDEEKAQLLGIITEETSIVIPPHGGNVIKLPSAADAPREAERPHSGAVSLVPYYSGGAAFYRGGLRSGQLIRFAGSVVLIGDANAGSEIVADGNIVVLGSLKGLAHAGAEGDAECSISALDFRPTQIRIAETIAYIPPNEDKGKGKQAYVQDGHVYIAPL